MQVPDKKLLLIIITFYFISFSFYSKNVYADNLDKIRLEYYNKNYQEALKLLKIEINKNPNNHEYYKLLGLIYEDLFELDKSMEAYKMYEKLKNKKEKIVTKISPLPKLTSSPSIKPLNKLEKIKSTPIPSILKKDIPKISPIPSKLIPTIKPLPSLKPTPIPKLVKNNENKLSIKTNNDGWENIRINKIEKKKIYKINS
ncbi:MAG: hypothetical protein KatS3mg068_0079 [Candidatus Sericytochromatia bacterium]|nr:MAG: hypothetical protein KatS3mg068_0079 [Candidatus Sericytochromatia bacterium]